MTGYVFGSVVVTSAVAANLRELSRRLDKSDCGGMFTTGLSATGNAPATHWISSGWIPEVYADTIRSNTLMFNRAKAAYEADGDVFPHEQAQITDALSNCTITDGTFNGQPETPQQLIARLGLKTLRRTSLPQDGLIAAYYADEYVASPRKHIPNAVSTEDVSANMVALPRRRFTSAYWGAANATLSDGITDPDGGTEAGRFNGNTGDCYFLMSSSPSLPAGTYTMAVTAKRHGGTDQTFVMDFYEVSQSAAKTATNAYQRFYHTATVPGGVTLLFFIRSVAAACDIDFIDVALYPGTVTDQNEPPLSGHLYLGANGFDTRPTYASGLLDLTNVGYGYTQFPALSLSAFTAIVVCTETVDVADFQAVLGSYGNYVTFTTMLDSGNGADAVFGGEGLYAPKLASGGLRLFNKGLKVIGQRFGAGASSLNINDVKLVQNAVSPSLPVSVKDFIFGAMQEPAYTGGRKYNAFALYDRALSDEEYADAYANLKSRAAETSNIVDATDDVLVIIGDSIASDQYSFTRISCPELTGAPLCVNYAVAGNKINHLDAIKETIASIRPANPGSRVFKLQIHVGANDLGTGTPPLDFLIALAALSDWFRVRNWYVIIDTTLPVNAEVINTGRAITNPEVRLWLTGGSLVPGIHADQIVDLAAHPVMGPDAAALDTDLYGDGIHPTPYGHTLLKVTNVAALNS